MQSRQRSKILFATAYLLILFSVASTTFGDDKSVSNYTETSIAPANVVQIRSEIEKATGIKWKSVLGFGGYSGSGYENPKQAEAVWRSILEKVPKKDRAKTLIVMGGTASGVGAVADLASSMGFPVAGLASQNAKGETIHPKVNHMFYVMDSQWGGAISGSARLHPASHALALAVDQLHVVGGGEVSAMEYILTKLMGKTVSFTPADMNHNYAKAKGINPAGAAYDIAVPERLQMARLIHETWRAKRLRSDGTYEPAPRNVTVGGSDQVFDIANLEYEKLPLKYQNLNLESADLTLEALNRAEKKGQTVDVDAVARSAHENYLAKAKGLKGAELKAMAASVSSEELANAKALVLGALEIKERHSQFNRDVFELAERMHEMWRSTRRVDSKDHLYEPRYKTYNGKTVDIANLAFADLPIEEQYRNLVVARATLQQLEAAGVTGLQDIRSLRLREPKKAKSIEASVYDSYKAVNGIESGEFQSLPRKNRIFIHDLVDLAVRSRFESHNSCGPDFTRLVRK